MTSEPESQREERQEGHKPRQPSKSMVICVIRAIKCRFNCAERQNKKPETAHQINERMMARWTRRVGVFTAALVFVAIVTGVIFWRQLGVMQGQLDEAKKQRLITIAQTRANLQRDVSVNAITQDKKLANAGESIGGFAISPYWTNVGSTDALDYRGWFDIRAFDIGPKVPRQITSKDCPPIVTPDPFPDGNVIIHGGRSIQLAKSLSFEDAAAAVGDKASKFTLMWGHVEYRDIYFPETPLHSDDWCVSVSPNDLQRGLFSFIILSEKVN
jgi:hypothetical protein